MRPRVFEGDGKRVECHEKVGGIKFHIIWRESAVFQLERASCIPIARGEWRTGQPSERAQGAAPQSSGNKLYRAACGE